MANVGHESFTATQSSPGVHQEGEVVEEMTSNGRKRYKYIKYDNGTGNLTLAAGDLVYFLSGSSYDGYTVTKDASDSDTNLVAGIAVGAISDGNFGWIQVGGYCTGIATGTEDGFTAGDCLIGGGSTDGAVARIAGGSNVTNKVVGWAAAADDDSNDTVPADLVLE